MIVASMGWHAHSAPWVAGVTCCAPWLARHGSGLPFLATTAMARPRATSTTAAGAPIGMWPPLLPRRSARRKKEAVQTHVPGQGLRLQRLPRRDMRDLLGHHPLHRGRAMCRARRSRGDCAPRPTTPSPATKRGRASTHPSGTVRSAARRTISVAAGSASTRPMTKPIAAPYAAAARRAATVCAARCARAATVPTVRFRRRSTRLPPGPRSTSAPARTSAARQ